MKKGDFPFSYYPISQGTLRIESTMKGRFVNSGLSAKLIFFRSFLLEAQKAIAWHRGRLFNVILLQAHLIVC